MGIDPMVICGEYTLERMEGAEEFLKCLGFSYLEIRLFLALTTNIKVRFIVDKGGCSGQFNKLFADHVRHVMS